MILHGRNLIITAGGMVIAAAKSCSISVSAETIKITDETDGEWEHQIAGLKSWSVSTNHLLEARGVKATIEAVAYAHTGTGLPQSPSFVTAGGITRQVAGRGLTLFEFDKNFTPNEGYTVDTYTDTEANCNELAALIGEAENKTMAIVSYDAFGINDNLKEAIKDSFKIPAVTMGALANGIMRGALVVIGSKDDDAGPGILMYSPPEKDSTGVEMGGSAHARLAFRDGLPTRSTPLKDAISRVGRTFTIRMQVDGLGSDYLYGQAICKSFKTTGTNGSLLTGTYSWEGSGPLQ